MSKIYFATSIGIDWPTLPTRSTAAESNRLDQILAHAELALGGQNKALEWLNRPNQALNGAIPLELLDTDSGAAQVDDVLGRLEHGVFS